MAELEDARLTANLFLLDVDFDYGCPSKRKIPRRGETPDIYRSRNYDESVHATR